MKKIIAIFLSLILVLTGAFAVYRLTSGKHEFPMWEEVIEQREIHAGAILEYEEKLFHEEQGYTLIIEITNKSADNANYGDMFYLDYQQDGQWFMVYKPTEIKLYAAFLESGGTSMKNFSIPANALSKKGHYRLYLENVGYCYFDI